MTLAEMGPVTAVEADGGRAMVRLGVTSPFCAHIGNLEAVAPTPASA